MKETFLKNKLSLHQACAVPRMCDKKKADANSYRGAPQLVTLKVNCVSDKD